MSTHSLEALLPHRAPMLLLDAVVAIDDESASARVHITPASPCFDAALDGVPAWVGMEYMAQTIGLWVGEQHLAEGKPIQPGFLLGTRAFDCNCAVFRNHSTLDIRVLKKYLDNDGIGVFECLIHENGAELARAQIKAYLPDNPEDFIRPRA